MVDSMNELLSSLNHLGAAFCRYAMGAFLQSSLLIVVLFGLDLLLRKHVRAVVRYCLWLLVLVKLILPPTLSLPTGIGYWAIHGVPGADHLRYTIGYDLETQESPPEEFAATTPASTEPVAVGPVESDSIVATIPTRLIPITWQATILLLWLIGVLAFIAILAQRIRFVRGLVKTSVIAEGPILASLEACRNKIHLRGRVYLRTSDALPSPAVCGLLRPTILMPTSLVAKLSPNELKATLIHELAHIKRADLWINTLQTVLQVVYFYHPFVWLANAMIRRTCEEAVDETVLVTLGGQVRDYSNTLINISEMGFWKADFGLRLIGVAESKKVLKRRIKHMLTQPVPHSSKIGILGTIAILLVAAVLLPMARAEKSIQEKFSIEGREIVSKLSQTNPSLDEGDVLVDSDTGIKFLLARTISGASNVIAHVNKLTMSPDARFLIFWGCVIPLDGTEPFRYTEHRGDVEEVAVSPNGQYIAHGKNTVWLQSVSAKTLHPKGPGMNLLDLEGGRLFVTRKNLPALHWTQDSQTVFFEAYDADGQLHKYAYSAVTGNPVRYPDAASSGLPSPDGKYVALTDMHKGFWIQPIGNGPARLLSENARAPLCWSKDGKWLIATVPWGGAWFVRYPEGQEYYVPLPENLRKSGATTGVGLSVDKRKIFFYQASHKLTYTVKVASAESTTLNNVVEGWYRINSWVPNGNGIFHTRGGKPGLYMTPLSGENTVEFSLGDDIPVGNDPFLVSPDGTWVLFTSDQDPSSNTFELNLMPLSITYQKVDGPVKMLFRIASKIQANSPWIVWSPDSTRVAFLSKDTTTDEQDIWVAFTDGRIPIRLTRTAAIEDDLKWSPNGDMLAFTTNDAGTVEMKAVPTSGGDAVVIRKWADASVPVWGWGWSPDNRSLTLVEDGMLMRQSLFGGESESIANLKEYGIERVKWLNWSPDGSRLALACPMDSSNEPLASWGQLVFARIQGGRFQKTGATDLGPATWTGGHMWSPDSKRVVYRDEGLMAMRPEGRLFEVAVDDIVESINAGAIKSIQSKAVETSTVGK